MRFQFNTEGYKKKECDIEVFRNDDGIVVKFFNKTIEPKSDKICDYVYVDAGYGYISLKRKGEDGILSGLLKKEFFSNESIIYQAIDFVEALMPTIKDAYIPYNLERIQVFDSLTYTGETFDNLDEEEEKTIGNKN